MMFNLYSYEKTFLWKIDFDWSPGAYQVLYHAPPQQDWMEQII